MEVIHGDAEAAVADILTTDPALTAHAPTVSTDLRGFVHTRRWVRITRSGGTPTLWMGLDNPLITIDCFAPEKGAAHDLATASRAAVFAARGVYTGHGLTIYDVDDAEGLQWEPDKMQPGTNRYVYTLTLVTRPA
jgi:hypothetical protein